MTDVIAHYPALAAMQATDLFQRMGLHFTAAGEGTAELTFDANALTQNVYGIVHGGAWLFLADSAMGGALATVAGEKEQVITSQIDFRWLRPLAGNRMLAKGRVIRRGRMVSHCGVELFDDAGRQIGAGSATYVITGASGTSGGGTFLPGPQ